MFFVLSKVLGFFALPSNLAVTLGLIGIFLMPTRWRRAGRVLACTGLVSIAVIGWSPLGNALMLPLEERFPPFEGGDVAGIVVLGGSITGEVSAARGRPALNEAAERLTEAVLLARRFPAARLVFTGGDGNLVVAEGTEGPHAEQLLLELGVPRERLVIEGRSRNTHENAVFTRELVRPRPGERWLLVTSAYHMPRSIGVFRRAGFQVEAHPVDWRMRGPQDLWRPFRTIGEGAQRTDAAVREWVGLVIYRLTDKTSALFPAP